MKNSDPVQSTPEVDRGPLPRDSRVGTAPQPVVARALTLPMTRHLVTVGAGYIQDEPGHTVERRSGLPDTVVSFCSAGRGWLRLGGAVHTVEAGTAMVIPARAPHFHGAQDPAWALWWVMLQGADIPEILGALGASLRNPLVAVPSVDRVVAMIDEILTGYEQHPSMAQVVEASGVAWRLLSFIAVDRFRPEPADPVERVMRHVAEHIDSRLDVRQLAASVGLSVSRLLARFQAATGGGVIAYQIQLRMAKAAQLLDNSTASIAEIARTIGYDDADYFSRRFHRTHGMSPSGFRHREKP